MDLMMKGGLSVKNMLISGKVEARTEEGDIKEIFCFEVKIFPFFRMW